MPRRRGEDPVFDSPIREDQHNQSPIRRQTYEFDMTDRSLAFWRQDKASAARDAGQRSADPIKDGRDIRTVAAKRGLDPFAILWRHFADFEQPVDEHPEPKLGGNTARGNMWTVEETEELQILHHIADCRRADLFVHDAGQTARPNRIARGQIALDHPAKDFARAIAHFGKNARVVVHGINLGIRCDVGKRRYVVSIGVASRQAARILAPSFYKDPKMRPSGRKLNELRPVSIETGVVKHAEGSCLIKVGDTHVLCTASLEEKAPPFLKNTGLGWVTAEYGMLPRATNTRNRREAAAGKQSGRTQEIQRLIGRSLRAGVDRVALGERQIVVDCDVIQADGGTRCASITGGWVALRLAVNRMLKSGVLVSDPIMDHVVALSCGIYAGQAVADLDYAEDSTAGTDGNFVVTGRGRLIEVQMSAEGATFSREEMTQLLDLAEAGAATLVEAQKAALA